MGLRVEFRHHRISRIPIDDARHRTGWDELCGGITRDSSAVGYIVAGRTTEQYAVVSAYFDDGTTIHESGPSNEVEFFVLEPPSNVRIQ